MVTTPDAPMQIVCRFPLDDGEQCPHGFYLEDHSLTPSGWICPAFDERTETV